MAYASVKHVGEIFGKLTIIGEGYNTPKNRVVLVRCECGAEKEVIYGGLLYGGTISCGCHRQSLLKSGITATHRMTNSVEYRTWINIRIRCSDHKSNVYHLYGGRGISVCPRWAESFENFFNDMGPKPQPYRQYSIERKNNNEGYSQENCYWATRSQQGRNKRNNRLLTLNGKTQTLVEWAQELGFKESMLQERLRRGWSEERTLSTPQLQYHQAKRFH